ncbi:winged helix DNA-binding domain-containing protein [Actinokineospora bangkokensis]|uniref:Winged helix DNA-binding domain-containing protein n=1 Tax=Actinokineospora bangkokensis TaxID=1193682 RepID=A0A1Q9LP64_9PSEU|nr:winged helix DNA-binding domain-containing protein [Actinokineospora bangkokensis]OLR93805.1 hypothetical protein BJP25_16345 [Actinokineospora bangkokensis]
MPDRLTPRALNRAYLARQLLLHRHPLTPAQALHHLIGLQAQAPDPPYLGLHARLTDFHPDHLADLLRTRAAARLSLMRGTLHLVTTDDAHTLRPLLQPLHDKATRTNGGPTVRTLTPEQITAITTRGRTLLTQRPMTAAELGTALATEFPGHPADRLAMIVRNTTSLTQIPPRGLWRTPGPAAHAPTDTWLPPTTRPPTTIDDLVLRYLAAYGPATPADARTWSGLTGLTEVFDRLTPHLRTYTTDTGTVLHDLPDAPRPDPDTPAPARLIADYDNLILSHADRTRVLPDTVRPHVLGGPNGVIPATTLVDGHIAGTWRLRRTRRTATIEITQHTRTTTEARHDLTAEAHHLLTTTDPDLTHEVTLHTP